MLNNVGLILSFKVIKTPLHFNLAEYPQDIISCLCDLAHCSLKRKKKKKLHEDKKKLHVGKRLPKVCRLVKKLTYCNFTEIFSGFYKDGISANSGIHFERSKGTNLFTAISSEQKDIKIASLLESWQCILFTYKGFMSTKLELHFVFLYCLLTSSQFAWSDLGFW